MVVAERARELRQTTGRRDSHRSPLDEARESVEKIMSARVRRTEEDDEKKGRLVFVR